MDRRLALTLPVLAQRVYHARLRCPRSARALGINPSNQLTVKVLIDIPARANLAKIELHDSPLSGGVTVALFGLSGSVVAP